ncbi:UvrD-helicase domain-containing protein [Shewanella yunxiaonensis]|uniref:DNA 3'-5' helicase n=1 Tax=Shewanella yunxiaonensis TaxID=2829809 RepID=A0ABX7YUL0_9GAMM|nr:UvrD-helicase domain-containing protein [Shewanella yunxiaonensis]QUN06359.1 UvrD-helicase domain-containing protein [Shewanella yunxiaonensis]
MSDSNDCFNISVMSNDSLDKTNIIDFYAKSNIFSIDKHRLVQPEHNGVIAKLTNPKVFNYTTNITKIISVLRDKEIVGNQQSLMQSAIDNVSEDTVDVDYIRFGFKLSKSDQDKLLSKNGDLFGIQNIKTNPRKERLSVSAVKVGSINFGYKTDGNKPYFTHKFMMCVDNDSYRYINVYFADLSHAKNKGRKLTYNCLIEFIPTRVSNQQVSFMMYQFYSLLGPRRYEQLISNAKLLELHTGCVMYGVSQLFAFLLTDNNKVKKGQCYPKEAELAAETSYVGRRSSDHLIGYDKPLKETKLFFETALKGWGSTLERVAKKVSNVKQLFTQQACGYRLESRRRFIKKPKKLADLCSVKSSLRDVKLLKPCYLQELSDRELKALIKDKSIESLSAMCDQLFLRTQEKSLYLSFDTERLDRAIKNRLSLLLDAISEPEKGLDEQRPFNYQAAVKVARKILKRLVKASRKKGDPVDKISSARMRAIYVEGCPGSGKTRLIVERVRHLLSQNIKPNEICVLAFTNEAAAEFRRRLKKNKLYNKQMFIGTFSSWCNQLLNASEKYEVLDQDGVLKALQSIVATDCKIAKAYPPDEIARRCLDVFNCMANYETPDLNRCIKKVAPDLVVYESDILAIHRAYKAYKKGKYRDFNDMLAMIRAYSEKDEFCQRIVDQTKYLIIDEIQDTNIVQWNIIKNLYGKGIHLFCVGDPAQSMYGFRGAMSEYLDKFTKKFVNSKRFQLLDNYRSTEPLVELTNHIRISINRNYSISLPVKGSDTDNRPRLKSCDEFKYAIDWLVKDLLKRNQPLSQFILCRYNYQRKRVESALSKAKIVHGDGKAVQVHTYHKGKGLEAEHCYVLDPQFSKCKLSSYKEELCNAYVALTRAKDSLTILVCSSGSSVYGLDKKQGKRAGKSIFLDLPEELVELVD